jgi:hypothetical protein
MKPRCAPKRRTTNQEQNKRRRNEDRSSAPMNGERRDLRHRGKAYENCGRDAYEQPIYRCAPRLCFARGLAPLETRLHVVRVDTISPTFSLRGLLPTLLFFAGRGRKRDRTDPENH